MAISAKGRRVVARVAVLVSLLVCAANVSGTGTAGAESQHDSGPRHREVVLVTDGETVRVVSQRVRPSALAVPGRQPDSGRRYRVEARGPGGAVVHSVEAADPREVHFDSLRNQKLTGGIARQTTARLVVQLPLDAEVEELLVTGEGVAATLQLPPLTTLEPAAAPASTTIRSNGPTSDRVDVAFLGDGYTSGELDVYRADVQRYSDYLFTQPPFSEYANFFNVHRVDVVSNQSGTDDTCLGTAVDTALDTGFFSTGTDCRLLWTNRADKVYAAAAAAPAADVIVIVVNTTVYGGAATFGGYGVFYRGGSGGEVMAHELGHSFGWLADEYDYGGATVYSGPEPGEANVTTNLDRGTVKWRRWIAPETPLPTVSWTPDVAGLYEGANYSQLGVYRPTSDSKMRSLDRPFERVNHALLVDRIFDYVPADASPPSGSVRRGAAVVPPEQISLDLNYADPQSYVLSYQLSNYSDFRDSADQPASNTASFTRSVTWTPLPGAGPKTIYARVTNGAGRRITNSFMVGTDLVVTGLSWSPSAPVEGNDVRFSATIKNQGTDATPAGVIHGVQFMVDGVDVSYSDTSTASLASGESRTVTANGGGSAGQWTATAGSHTVRAHADGANRIAEGNETNNTLNRALAITSQRFAPFYSAAGLVRQQYVDFIGRQPNQSELSSQVTALSDGTKTKAGLVSELAHSTTFGGSYGPIARLYFAYFLRSPDRAGLDYWVGRYRNGTSLSAISGAFAGSNEFKTRYGTLTNREFVEKVYLNVLGRPGDSGGIAYWTGQLDQGRRTRGAVMIGFSESNEFKRVRREEVDTILLYRGLLQRTPTGAELTAQVQRLETGTALAAIINEILATPAYAERITP